MAEPDPPPPMLAIQRGQLEQLQAITSLMGTQNTQHIERFIGDPKKFQSWIKSIDKYLIVVGACRETSIKSVALQSSEGAVSEFLLRFYRTYPDCTWTDVYAQLKSRFSDIIDTQHALQVLRTTKQKVGETAQVYAERLICVAEQAWPDSDLTAPLISQQLTDCFIDGLTDSAVARRVLREGPQTFTAAVQIAVSEQNLTRKIQLRNRAAPKFQYKPKLSSQSSQEEPMEVDSFRGSCYKCGKPGHRAINCRSKMSRVHEVRLTCFKCGQSGHVISKCTNPGNPQTGRCWNCGQRNHRQAQCQKKTGTPQNNEQLNEQTLA